MGSRIWTDGGAMPRAERRPGPRGLRGLPWLGAVLGGIQRGLLWACGWWLVLLFAGTVQAQTSAQIANPESFENLPLNSAFAGGNGSGFTVTNARAHTGTQSVRSSSSSALFDVDFQVTKGSTYTVSYWQYCVNTTDCPAGSYTYMSAVPGQVLNNTGGANYVAQACQSSNAIGVWYQCQATFTVPSNASSSSVWFRLATYNGGVFYIDDFSLQDASNKVSLSKTNPAQLREATSSTYRLRLSNTGTVATGTHLTVYDQLPPQVAYSSASAAATGSANFSSVSCAVTAGSVAAGQFLTCSLQTAVGGLAVGSHADVSLVVTPTASAVGSSVSNHAITDPTGNNAVYSSAQASACTGTDTPSLGCAATPALTVASGVSLSLSKTNPAQAWVGASAAYGLSVSNSGPVASGTSLVVYDQLPANFQYDGATPLGSGSVTPTAVSCSASGQVSTGLLLACTLSLPPGGLPASGGSAAFSLQATPQAGAGGVAASNRAAIDPSGQNAAQTPSTCTANGAPSAGCAVAAPLTPHAGATAAQSQLSVSPAGPLVAGVGSYDVTVTARDSAGAVVSGVATTFSISSSGGSLSANNCTTATSGASAGSCSVTLGSTAAATHSVAATLGGTAIAGSPANAAFVAGGATAAASRVSLSSGPKIANGSDAYTLTATAYDAHGNLASGSAVTFSFSAPGAGASLSASTCTTSTGSCSVTLTATTAGSYAITTSLGGSAVGGSNPVTAVFDAGSATAAQSRVSISSGPLTADGVAAYTLTATANDAQGNLVSGSSNTFTFSAPAAGATLSASSCTTSGGSCSVQLRATVAGSYPITASLASVALGGSNPVTGVFVAGQPVASASRLAIDAGPRTADGVDAYTVTVTANDAQGNLNTSTATTFSFDPLQPGSGATLSASSCTTATTGPDAGRCSVRLQATVAGSYAVSARLDGGLLGGTNPVSGVFVAGSPAASGSRVSLSAGPRMADGSDSYTLTVTANDAQGNLSSSPASTFSFSAPAAGASLSASSCTTAVSGAQAGTCTVTLSATVAGSYPITASLGGSAVGGSNPVTGVFVAGHPSASSARVTISAGPQTADGVSAYTLTARATDANGNLNTASAQTFAFSDPGAGASLSASSCTTATSGPDAGTCTVALRATVAGSYAVTASLGGSALGGTNPVTGVFVAGPVTAAGSRLSIGPAGPLTADGVAAYTLTVRAQDAQGNLNSSAPVSFAFSAPAAGATLSASSCTTATSGAQAGTCTVTLSATGAATYSVGASLAGTPVGGTNPVSAAFVAGEAVAATARASIDAGPKQANGADAYTLTARATDAFGNLDSSRVYNFSFSPPGAGASLSALSCSTPTSGPTAGTCAVTLTATVAATYSVSVSLGGEALGGTNPLSASFVAGAVTAASARVSLSSGPKVANGSDAYTLTVRALDAQGNLNTSSALTVDFSAPAAGATLSAGSCTTATSGPQAGTCTVTLTATVAGSYPITASQGGTPLGGSNPVTGVFSAGPVAAGGSTLTIDSGPKTANGSDAYTLTVTARDANGNLVSTGSSRFDFTLDRAGATLSAAFCQTTAGVCSVTVSATVAASYAVTATINGQNVGGSNPAQAVFGAGAVSAGSSRLSLTPGGPRAANGVDAYTLTASAFDAQGNLVSGVSHTFVFSAPAAGSSLSASQCSTTTGTCSVQWTATVVGTYQVGATLWGTPLGGTNPVSATFQAGVATAAQSQALISSGPKLANGQDAYTVSAVAYDAQSNPVTLNPVTFTFAVDASLTGATLSALNCVTPTTGAQAGRCSVTLVSTRAESIPVQVRLDGSGLGSPLGNSPVSGVFVANGATAGRSTVSIDLSGGLHYANGSDGYTITVSALDAQGNLNRWQPQTFALALVGAVTRSRVLSPASLSLRANPANPGATLSATQCTTATTGPAAGTCTVVLRSTEAGWATVQASLAGTPVGQPANGQVAGQFMPGLASAAESRLSLDAGPKWADGVAYYTLTASAQDAFGNPQTDGSAVFTFSPPGAGSSLSALTCRAATSGAAAGSCSVTWRATVVGVYPVQASLNGSAVGSPANGQVSAQFVAPAVAVGGGGGVAPVPTLAEWARWALVLLLPGLAVAQRRRGRLSRLAGARG